MMEIGGITVDGGRTLVAAELSANHGGSFETAVRTLQAMKESGADAVKLQTYRPASLSLECDGPFFGPKTDGLWEGWTSWDLFREAQTPWEWHPGLKAAAEDMGMLCFSSPFDKEAVDFLVDLDMPAFKIASFEITDIPLIEQAASHGKPMIISTGVALPEDIDAALDACRRVGNEEVILLKCVSAYPAPLADMNLLQIPHLRETWRVPVGLSDHTEGWTAATAAVALGAVLVEKHFILDRGMDSPDAAFSMEPREFRSMVDAIREVEAALGLSEIRLSSKQEASRLNRRSLFVVEDVCAGDLVTTDNVRSIRPGAGLPPIHFPEILGRHFVRDVPRGEPLRWDDLDGVRL